MGLKKAEEEIIFDIAERWTGTCQRDSYRKEVLVQNVENRMVELRIASLSDYLRLVRSDEKEQATLLSCLTIHTTNWFREAPHFDNISDFVLQQITNAPGKTAAIRVCSMACSTGEEVYSLALCLEKLKERSDFTYQIDGFDIDPLSIDTARKAVYRKSALEQIPQTYTPWLLYGTGPVSEYFAMAPEIRRNCRFSVRSILEKQPGTPGDQAYDVIVCRNLLIYFTQDKITEIVQGLAAKLKPGGLLVLGHCEALRHVPTQLKSLGRACYSKHVQMTKEASARVLPIAKLKALVIDDSPTIRKSLERLLGSNGFSVSHSETAEEASQVVLRENFDLITLDLNMPGENGAAWLQRQRKRGLNTPVVIISDSTPSEAGKVFGALLDGAQDYIIKSRLSTDIEGVVGTLTAIATKKLSHAKGPLRLQEPTQKNLTPRVILIGASTGGADAIAKLLANFPKPSPPIVVVQHITCEFARAFAERMAKEAGLSLGSDTPGTPLMKNHIYIALGDYHLEVLERDFQLVIGRNVGEKVHGHRPSVDQLFMSAAKANIPAVSVILTGMGEDGARGMLQLLQTGKCFTIGQDENSSVVFGMPKRAMELNSLCYMGNIEEIREEILRHVSVGK